MAGRPAASASARLPLVARALAAAGIVAALELASKWAILAWVMNPPRVIPVLPSFNLVLGFNRGVSFGLLSDLGSAGPTIVSAMTAAIVGLLTVWLWRARLRSERSEEHTSELQSLMRSSYAVFFLKKTKLTTTSL